jgi:site-specific recombinase XerD
MHFFQKRLLHPKVNVWYAAQPIGKNTLASMMSTISNEAGLSVRYTNHCIMATVATGLKGSGVDNLSIMSVTGHRNVKSLESYIAGPTEQQRRELSHTLQRVASADKSALGLKDLNMFSQVSISGGTININVINKQ